MICRWIYVLGWDPVSNLIKPRKAKQLCVGAKIHVLTQEWGRWCDVGDVKFTAQRLEFMRRSTDASMHASTSNYGMLHRAAELKSCTASKQLVIIRVMQHPLDSHACSLPQHGAHAVCAQAHQPACLSEGNGLVQSSFLKLRQVYVSPIQSSLILLLTAEISVPSISSPVVLRSTNYTAVPGIPRSMPWVITAATLHHCRLKLLLTYQASTECMPLLRRAGKLPPLLAPLALLAGVPCLEQATLHALHRRAFLQMLAVFLGNAAQENNSENNHLRNKERYSSNVLALGAAAGLLLSLADGRAPWRVAVMTNALIMQQNRKDNIIVRVGLVFPFASRVLGFRLAPLNASCQVKLD